MRFNSSLIAGSAFFWMAGMVAPKLLSAQKREPVEAVSAALPDAPAPQNAFLSILIPLAAALLLAMSSSLSSAQQSASAPAALPDAPDAQVQLASNPDPQPIPDQAAQPPAASTSQSSANAQQSQSAQPPASDSAHSSSASQAPAQQSIDSATKQEKEKQEVKEQEQQRVLGIVPNFNLTYRHDAVSLTAVQKMQLSLRAAVDPFQFAAAFMVAGYHEALDEDTGFGWGPAGYFKRSGAAYLDAFDGDIIGNGILPAVLHQDPRYFRLGYGSIKHRILYSAATNFICKGDNGHWQPNISNVGGNIIAGALSNLYYPSQNSGWGQTIGNGFIVTTEGAFGSIFDEFWPDISRHFLHKDPTHGLDALQAAEAREKTNGKSGSAAGSGNDSSNPK